MNLLKFPSVNVCKGIFSGRLYQKIRASCKFSFGDITRNLCHKNCFIESFEN